MIQLIKVMKEVQNDLNLGDIFNNFELLMEPWMIGMIGMIWMCAFQEDVSVGFGGFNWKSYGGFSGLRVWFGFDCGGFDEFWQVYKLPVEIT